MSKLLIKAISKLFSMPNFFTLWWWISSIFLQHTHLY